jgi:hypothetical protein
MLSPYLGTKPARVAYNGHEFTRRAEALWQAKTGRPLSIIAGPTWEAGVVTTYASRHPSFFVEGEIAKNPWITPARLAVEGMLAVWPQRTGSSPPSWVKRLEPFSETGLFSIPYSYGEKKALVAWAIVPPDNDRKWKQNK